MKVKTVVLTSVLTMAPSLLHAQYDFKVEGRTVQIHSFGSQGFLWSNQNNYMSMPTSKGSFAFTDGGANISTQVTDKFRVGAQIFLRNVGEFGNWEPELDWAYGSYKFTGWLGVRAGKVKTTLGLYNDIQDMDSLHTFALLPEAIYPLDWRSVTIAHVGADVFGSVSVKHAGNLAYTGYVGSRPFDTSSGYVYAYKGAGITLDSLGGRQAGGDVRWNLPFGAVFGASYLDQDITGTGKILTNAVLLPYHQNTTTDTTAQFYGQYTFKNLKFDVEYRKNLRDINLYRTAVRAKSIVDSRGWYVAGTYRLSKWLELGAYRSQYYVDTRKDTEPALAHEFDTTVSARFDFINHLYLKCEGHFIDGAPTSPSASRGFYALSNPGGYQPTTNLLMLRTGFSF